ncbi:glycerol-3-phosphate acyltransferase [Stemphylium lycopersici]|uniref:Glycerol-3-phosphate acyltransferase n=1 Tax=Stemphylium lycopersici TaxID=183478 RepID=A0A364NAY9_STELY|nr:glycerol-3-phosphate acyltransferase [Stemphylium lycopersici]
MAGSGEDRESSTPTPSTPEQAPDLSITADDNVHLHAAGYNESPDRGLIHSFARFRSSPLNFLREVSLHFSGSGWRSFDDHIGQPEFYSGFSEEMKGRVLSSPMLVAKIRELADKRVEVEAKEGLLGEEVQNGGGGVGEKDRRSKRRVEIEESLMQVSEGWTDSMICKMESKSFIRGAYYFATQLLTRAYHQGVHVSSEEVLRLRAVAEKAEKDKHSIIFLPCHRSHVDYVSLQIICYRLGLALPTVVAGDNLNFPVVGSFLQHAGAMWIRRSFGDDQLYITLVQAYIDTLLRCGYNLECFVEGGRSRTGKLLPPKFGILSYMLDSVASGRVEDAIICPVSTQYDKVIEVDSYISELLGQPKPKENLMDFLSASSVLSLKLGRVDVRFHEPWSLKSFITQQRERFSKLPQQLDTKEDRLRLLRTLGYKVLSEINDVSVVMPTALVGTVLLTLRGRGVGKTELIRRVEWLSVRVRAQGGRVAHFGNLPTSVVVDRALEVLGPGLVGLVPGLPEDTFYAVDRFQLSFYRNMTIHLFILQSLVSAALYTHVKQGGGPEYQRMSYTDLRAQVHFLSQLFRGEFIFPTEGLDTNLAKTLAGLEKDGVITMTRATSQADGQQEEGGAAAVEWIQLSPNERAQGRENYDFYCFLIWPFIEAAWLGAISLMMLTPPPPPTTTTTTTTTTQSAPQSPWLDMKKIQDRAQLLGKTLYHQGDLSYFEAVNKETLKNAYTRFQEEGMVLVSKSRGGKPQNSSSSSSGSSSSSNSSSTMIRLADEWVPRRKSAEDGAGIVADGALWRFAERISASRREGKNRRDGATVQTRVLGLVDVVGKGLWEDAVLDVDGLEKEDGGGRGAKTKSIRKRGNMAKL